jgi:alkylated DNA repair dioxygenase AlkB
MKPLRKGTLLGLQVKQVADHVTYRVMHDMPVPVEGTGGRTLPPVVEIALGGNAMLWWCAWPDFLPRPHFPDDAKYHPVRAPYGGMIDQPRKTVCYGHAYRYSGQVHPVEPETPEEILQLYRLVGDIFGGVQVNMCLANGYYHGNHSISKHSDDEKQMGDLHDVFCFVTGATRPAIFRTKEKSVVVLKVDLPEGLYVMRGSDFQKNYTHEFPKVYETAFKNAFVKCVPMDLATTMEKADWLWMHRDEVQEKLRGTKYFDDFVQWSQSRFSFTLRHFKQVKEEQVKEDEQVEPPNKRHK